MSLSFSLHDKSILLTGATGYLGSAMTYGLAKAGASLIVNGRSVEVVEELVENIRSIGGVAQSAVFNVRDEAPVAEFFKKRKSQPLHGLINNAYSGKSGCIEDADASEFRDSYDIVVIAAQNLVRAALPALRLAASSGGASVINICSMYGLVSPDLRVYDSPGTANPPFYGAAKAALIQWTRYAACEFGNENIRFNSISPGPFPSDEVRSKNPELIDRLMEKVPMGRVGLAKEIAGPVVFLASEASSYVNGSNIVVDGGWTCW
jgi:NAD(P)-dependent dehydrogenase (short-subunit alcohol dehydrogenase family)